MEAVINFKWQRFARQRFLFYWGCQVVFFILFGVAVSMDDDIDKYSFTKYLLLVVMFMSLGFLLQEFRYAIKPYSGPSYQFCPFCYNLTSWGFGMFTGS